MHQKFSGLSAGIFFSSMSGSIETDVFLIATQGQGDNPSGLVLSVFQTDLMTGNGFNGCASVPLTSSQLQFTRSANLLATASLNITGLALQDCFSGSILTTADISITWSAFGSSTITRNNYVFRYGTETLRSHSQGSDRSATVSGSLTLDGTDLLAGITAADYFADLQQSSYVDISLIRAF
jgi:hypothetical protein